MVIMRINKHGLPETAAEVDLYTTKSISKRNMHAINSILHLKTITD